MEKEYVFDQTIVNLARLVDSNYERPWRIGPRSLAGKPLAGFCATQSRRIQVLYGIIVHVIRCNTHYFIDNRR